MKLITECERSCLEKDYQWSERNHDSPLLVNGLKLSPGRGTNSKPYHQTIVCTLFVSAQTAWSILFESTHSTRIRAAIGFCSPNLRVSHEERGINREVEEKRGKKGSRALNGFLV